MKILVLNGSPRPKGNTAGLVAGFVRGAEESGHTVTVAAATGTAINVAFTLVLATGVTWDSIKTAVSGNIQAYFDDLIGSWADSDYLVARISQMEARILDVTGVTDISGTTLNGKAENVTLGSDAIPILGAVTNNDS